MQPDIEWEPIEDIDPRLAVVSLTQKRTAQLVDASAIDLASSDVARWRT